jgi:hypothetical protein
VSSPPAPSLPLRDRPLSDKEFEQLRLLMSCFRDGSGGHKRKDGSRQPNWRDFERVIAEVVGAETGEDKGIFDVVVPAEPGRLPYGLSCKQAAYQPAKHNCVLIELANPAAEIRDVLKEQGIDAPTMPKEAGIALIEMVESWHQAVDTQVDVPASSYVTIAHDPSWQVWRIAWFDLNLRHRDPETEILWSFEGQSLRGTESASGRQLWSAYLTSGGQMKYFPSLEWARWTSREFSLEMPPVQETLTDKARRYFADRWPT